MIGLCVARPGLRRLPLQHAATLASRKRHASVKNTATSKKPLTSILIANRGEIALFVYF